MDLNGYSTDELIRLLGMIRPLKAAALLDLQQNFLAQVESYLTAEIGRRSQRAAG